MRLLLLILLAFSISVPLAAQNRDEELAAQYYLNGEFEKAIDLYEKLHRKTPENTYIYSNYLNSFLALNRFDEAEKLVRKQIRKFENDYTFDADLLYVLDKAARTEERKKETENLIRGIKDTDQAYRAFIALMKRNYRNEGLEALLKGRKLSGDKTLFARELVMIYGDLGNKSELIRELCTLVEENPLAIDKTQELAQAYFSSDEDWNLLKKELQNRLQKDPDYTGWQEMIMWVLVQQKNFEGAFIQFRALDKKNKEGGKRILDLALISLQNQEWDMAAKCYEYVKQLGEGAPYFYQALYGLLDVRYRKIVVYGRYNQEDLLAAEKEFSSFVNSYSSYFNTEIAERQLAYLYNFYLDKPDSAIALLNRIIANPSAPARFRGEVKLDLGDCYVMQGDVWEAELLYSQVDKDFKEDVLGQEAKFRMAKLFYYKGEFERSKAYLDVLKTATTQLISNNAIELSMLIQDNTGLDSTEEAMQIYAEADLLIYRNKIREGLEKLDQLNRQFPNHVLADEILWAKFKAMKRQNLPDSGLYFLNKILTEHGEDILADNALYELAQLYEKELNQPAKAMELYEKLMLQYPGSLFVVEARKSYRRLRGDKPDTDERKELLFNGFMN